MFHRLRAGRPSPAMVVASIALIIALGGTSYAAIKLPKNSVGTKHIKRNAVTGAKVKDFSLFANDFAAGQLPKGAPGERGPAGEPGAPGAAGAPGPSNGYYGIRRDTFAITNQLDVDTDYITLTALPAGSYILNGHLTAVKFATPYSMVRCGIKAAGADTGSGGNGYRHASAVGGDTSPVVSMMTSLAVTSPTSFDAILYCRQGLNAGAAMEEGRLEAIKVGSLEVSGGP